MKLLQYSLLLVIMAASLAHAYDSEALVLDEAFNSFGQHGYFNQGRSLGTPYGRTGYQSGYRGFGYGWAGNFQDDYGYGYGFGTSYGQGGFGDASNISPNKKICTASMVDQSTCTADYPDASEQEWRFIKGIGWRKFTKYGAARKDWWDYKKTFDRPFLTTYSTLR
jgi:hypothetical protein